MTKAVISKTIGESEIAQTSAVIKKGRERLKMAPQQLANLVGVSRTTVQKWERGSTAPKRRNQAPVASVLGISISVLMGLASQDDGAQESNEVGTQCPDSEYAHCVFCGATEGMAIYSERGEMGFVRCLCGAHGPEVQKGNFTDALGSLDIQRFDEAIRRAWNTRAKSNRIRQ